MKPGGGTASGIDFDEMQTSSGTHYKTEPSQSIITTHDNDDQYSPPPLPNEITWQVHVFAYADGTNNAYVDCEYTVRVFVANIRTNGTKDVPNSIDRKLLVGQTVLPEVKPYLDIPYAPAPGQSNPFSRQSISSYQKFVRWTFDKKSTNDPGIQEPFYRWNGSDSGSTAVLLKDLGDSRTANSTDPLVLTSTASDYIPELHWSYPYNTNNARIYVAARQLIGNPGVELKFKLSQLIKVLRPTPTLDSTQGQIFVKSNDNGAYVDPLDDNTNTRNNPPSDLISVMQARSSSNFSEGNIPTNQGPGIKWTGSVKEPAEFEGRVQGMGPIQKGTWCFVQLFRGKRSVVDAANNRLYWGYNSHVYFDSAGNEDISRVFILDEAFPYGRVDLPLSLIMWAADPDTITSSTTGMSEDSPYLPLYNLIADPNTHLRTQRRSASMNDRFELYLMYKPPPDLYSATDSQWVPLKKLSWHTDATATLTDIVAPRWHLIDGSNVTRDDISDWILHPVWQNRFDRFGSLHNFFATAP